jgi:protein-tyrosine phosphatase
MTGPAGADVVVVCTANQCRSPAAAAVLAAGLSAHGIRVAGAGLAARVGTPVDERTRQAVPETPADLVAVQLTPSMVAGAALVLTMTRQHRTAVVGLVPSAVRRTFTLTEFADLVDLVSVHDELPADPAARLARLVAAAPRQRGARGAAPGRPDDVEDPYLLDAAAYRVIIDQVREAAESVVDVVRGPAVTAASRP